MRNIDFIILIVSIVLICYVFSGLSGRTIDFLILTLYIIGVIYVFNRARESIDDEITIKFEKEALNEQITEQELQNVVGVEFKLKDKYEIDKLQELELTIQNKSETSDIYLHWDNSSLTGYDGRSRRVIWLTPEETRDPAVGQMPSVIAPGKTLKERLTAADVLKRDAGGISKPDAPLVSLALLKGGSDSEKKLYNGFMNSNLSLQFSLRLVFRLFDPATSAVGERFYALDCSFTVNKLPWTAALPWNQKRIFK